MSFYYVPGYFSIQRVYATSSQLLGNYNAIFNMFLLGVGSTVPDLEFQIYDWVTSGWVASNASVVLSWYLFYLVPYARYQSLQCPNTGYHRFVYTRNGTRVAYLYPSILQLSGELTILPLKNLVPN